VNACQLRQDADPAGGAAGVSPDPVSAPPPVRHPNGRSVVPASASAGRHSRRTKGLNRGPLRPLAFLLRSSPGSLLRVTLALLTTLRFSPGS